MLAQRNVERAFATTVDMSRVKLCIRNAARRILLSVACLIAGCIIGAASFYVYYDLAGLGFATVLVAALAPWFLYMGYMKSVRFRRHKYTRQTTR